MNFSDIHMRDPFILPYEGKYYLIGTPGQATWGMGIGFWLYVSEDLENWSEPIKCFDAPAGFWADRNFWAPELHVYKGRFYIFAAFKSETHARSVQILSSDRIEGPYTVWSEPITPGDWECLDGTLIIENDTPYMVFCHEWAQIGNGTMCVLQLSDDLKHAVGEPTMLFHASDDPAVVPLHEGKNEFVTDGPFMFREKGGRLLMLWSSFCKAGYLEAIAVSKTGSVFGPWQFVKPLSEANGGHGMVFRDFAGKLFFTMHQPNTTPLERPQLVPVKELEEEPYLSL